MRYQQILREEVLRKVIELDVVGSKTVRSCDTTYAGELMHVLSRVSTSSHREEEEKGQWTYHKGPRSSVESTVLPMQEHHPWDDPKIMLPLMT